MRVEVLGGVERRRRWSRDDKMRIIEETLAPGAVVTERRKAQRTELLRRAKEVEAGMRIANVLLSTSSEVKVVTPGCGDVAV